MVRNDVSRGKLLIFSAPSGSGKSTIINWLMENHPELNMKFSISCTSRPPRGKEQNGVEYFFLTPEEFRKKHETIVCRDLLKGLAVTSEPTPEKRTEQYYKVRPCVKFVRTAAEILDRYLEENPSRGAEL